MKGMKDYYKVLGVEKTASEKDIRARWIELIREFHPDGRRGAGLEEGKSKEINEAYQVLKHSNTRVEYDLKTAFYRKKRSLYLRRLVLLLAISLGSLRARRGLPDADRGA